MAYKLKLKRIVPPYTKLENAPNNTTISIGSIPLLENAPSHVPGGSWKSITKTKPLSDLERKALALWAPPEYIDRWPGKAEAIRNAVERELGCIELFEYEEQPELQAPAHMIMIDKERR